MMRRHSKEAPRPDFTPNNGVSVKIARSVKRKRRTGGSQSLQTKRNVILLGVFAVCLWLGMALLWLGTSTESSNNENNSNTKQLSKSENIHNAVARLRRGRKGLTSHNGKSFLERRAHLFQEMKSRDDQMRLGGFLGRHKDGLSAKIRAHDNPVLIEESNAELVDMRTLNRDLAFDNPDGGAWKQGWDVKNTHKRPLTIYVSPHSHCDPGWIKTFDEYFQSQTKQILTTVINALKKDDRRKFIWAEISYFEWWWNEQRTSTQEQVRRLLESGQLEFVTGGWVQPDEANTQLYAMEVQLQEGHDWIRKTFGEKFIPKYGWSIDPFGYSPTMPYLLKKYGFKAILIQRVHYAVKKELASRKHLEFKWRQTWDTNGDYDMMTHVMPFFSYDVPHTCGPDPSVCCQFDFARSPVGTVAACPWHKNPQTITAENVERRAMLLLDQYEKKAELYRTNTVFIPVGDDFRYMSAREAENQYTNYQAIFDYINAHVDGVSIQFGTLSQYFTAVAEQFEKDDNLKIPMLKGSFFTYADVNEDYWSGYFTSRVFDKALDRQLERVLYAATQMGATTEDIQDARRTLGLFQHHDGVTGTAKNHVVEDYAKRIHDAIHQVQEYMQAHLKGKFPDALASTLQACWQSDSPRGLSENLCGNEGSVYLYNPLSRPQSCGDVTVHGQEAAKANLPCETPSGNSDWVFDDRTGLMKSPYREEWMVWDVQEGGAYLFHPGVSSAFSSSKIQIEKNGLIVTTPNWKRTVVKRASKNGEIVIDFVYETHLQTSNQEWFVRFSAADSIHNKGVFYTDLNGFNFDTHYFRKDMPIQSQVFPMPTLACIQDDTKSLTVLSEHAQGTASLQDGSIDVWLDRRLSQDDNRGLFQGVMDNVPTRTRLRVVLETDGYHNDGEYQPSQLVKDQWEELNHPLEMFGKHTYASARVAKVSVAKG